MRFLKSLLSSKYRKAVKEKYIKSYIASEQELEKIYRQAVSVKG